MSEETSLAQTKLLANIPELRKVKRSNGRHYTKYSLEDKHKGCLAYLIHGTFLAAGEATGINHDTLIYWSKTDWWKEQTQKYREQLEEEYRAKGHKIITKAQEAIIDRLEHGDVYVDKRGNQKRRPVSMREATFTYGVTYDKQRISLEKPTQVVVTQPDPTQVKIAEEKDQWLRDLADGFIQATKYIASKTIEGSPSADSKRPQEAQPEEVQTLVVTAGDEASGGNGPLDESGRDSLPASTVSEV